MFSKRKDSRFVKNVKSIVNDYTLVNLVAYGNKRMDQVCYYIAPDASGSGFFADHNRLLSYLYYADCFGMIPVVEYSSGYSYAEKEPVNGTTNPFEYYFKQPGNLSIADVREAKMVIKSRKENAAFAGKLNQTGLGYDWSDEYCSEMGRISAKYIRFNDEVALWMEKQVNQILDGKKVLGVHVRGTDFKRNYKGHPIKVTTEEYLQATVNVMTENQYDRVFLATDDIEARQKFIEAFGAKLFCYDDVVRSSGNETVMKSESDRPQHHYHLGLEVLRDAWTLGNCDGLVAGLSQVSFGARIFKKSFEQEYEDLRIMDKGMNLQ